MAEPTKGDGTKTSRPAAPKSPSPAEPPATAKVTVDGKAIEWNDLTTRPAAG